MDLVHFQFEGVKLKEACWISGKPYFTRRTIGEWLEYNHPREAINKIVQRNPHINDPRWSTGVNLTSVEGDREVVREVRVYDPVGLQLIIFESRQPKAIAYKVAVANLVWSYMNGKLKPSKWTLKDDLVAAARQIHSHPPTIGRGELMRDLAEREGCSLATIYRRVARATGKRLRSTQRRDLGRTFCPEERKRVFDYVAKHPQARGAEIRATLKLNVSADTINVWLRKAR